MKSFVLMVGSIGAFVSVLLTPALGSAEWRCGGFRITSPKPVRLQDGEYDSTLQAVTRKGTCSRFNDDSIDLTVSKQGRSIRAAILPEGLTFSGRTPSCGGTGISKNLSPRARIRQTVDVLATGASGETPASFSVFYSEFKGRKMSCFRSFQ